MAGKNVGYAWGYEAFAILVPLSLQPYTTGEVRRILMMPQVRVHRNMKRLHEAGIIAKLPDGKWRMVRGLTFPKLLRDKSEPATFMPTGIVTQLIKSKVSPTILPPEYGGPAVSEPARALATKLNVPARRVEGEVSLGTVGRCSCGAATPFRWGKVTICPICARK